MKQLQAAQLGWAIRLVWVEWATAGQAKSREERQQHFDLVLFGYLYMQQKSTTYTKHKHSKMSSYTHEIKSQTKQIHLKYFPKMIPKQNHFNFISKEKIISWVIIHVREHYFKKWFNFVALGTNTFFFDRENDRFRWWFCNTPSYSAKEFYLTFYRY